VGIPSRIALTLLLSTLVAASFVMTSGDLPSAPSTVGPRAQAPSRGGFQALREPFAPATGDADLVIPASTLAPTPSPRPTSEPVPVAAAPAADPIISSTVAPTPQPATPRPPAAPVMAPVATSGSAAEFRALALMNNSRAQAGVGPLTLDAGVSLTARAHSAAESRVGYVYHDGLDGTAQSRDAAACGTGWYGENTGKVWNGDLDALHSDFMAEPLIPINHHTNIVDPNFKWVGIGAVQGSDALYLTMVFCR
jgi:uncharacterized protein YkwD